MSIFHGIPDILKANINVLLDKPEDLKKMVRQMSADIGNWSGLQQKHLVRLCLVTNRSTDKCVDAGPQRLLKAMNSGK